MPPLNLPTNTKTLLNSISREAWEGELFAVMGASGFGKSTLVDALAGWIPATAASCLDGRGMPSSSLSSLRSTSPLSIWQIHNYGTQGGLSRSQ